MTLKTIHNLFRHNDEMPQEEWEELRAGFIRLLKPDLAGRRLMSIRRLPAGTQTFSYDRIKTEGRGAAIIGKGAIYPYDEYSIERVSVDIKKYGRAFRIPMEDFEAGVIQNEQVAQTRRFMAEKENSLVLQGDADFNVLGLVDFAGNTFGGGDWSLGSETPDGIYDDIRSLLRLFAADNVTGPFTMAVSPETNVDLGTYDPTDGRIAEELVSRIIARILVTDGLPANNALVMATGPDIAQLGLVEDINLTRPRFDDDRDVWKGKARARGIPIVYQYGGTAGASDAIGTLTGI